MHSFRGQFSVVGDVLFTEAKQDFFFGGQAYMSKQWKDNVIEDAGRFRDFAVRGRK